MITILLIILLPVSFFAGFCVGAFVVVAELLSE